MKTKAGQRVLQAAESKSDVGFDYKRELQA